MQLIRKITCCVVKHQNAVGYLKPSSIDLQACGGERHKRDCKNISVYMCREG